MFFKLKVSWQQKCDILIVMAILEGNDSRN